MAFKKTIRNNAVITLSIVFIAIMVVAIALFIFFLQILGLNPSLFNLSLSAIIIVFIAISVGIYIFHMIQKEITRLERYVHQGLHSGSVPPPEIIKWKGMNDIATDIYEYVNTHFHRNNNNEPHEDNEQQKRDILLSKQIILNNLNHEIKTPIGIIQGYVDTLLEHDEQITPDMRRRFLKKCLDTTQRLQNMAYSLSVISRLDNGKDAILMDDVNLTECISNVFEDMRPILDKYGMKATHNLPNMFIVHSNVTLLYNIFTNLVKNAAFYSEGSLIMITLLDDGKISFRDNGKGVDEDFLPKIFDRFYRIDKDRNRNMSSSGLGLSIVKSAVELHGSSIIAKNHPDGGLQFIFRL
ncbi:MAG: sensor histidine kinase [Muribaculaceae bacterium]